MPNIIINIHVMYSSKSYRSWPNVSNRSLCAYCLYFWGCKYESVLRSPRDKDITLDYHSQILLTLNVGFLSKYGWFWGASSKFKHSKVFILWLWFVNTDELVKKYKLSCDSYFQPACLNFHLLTTSVNAKWIINYFKLY